MAPDPEPNGIILGSPLDPSTPPDAGQSASSQATLPSTEIPASPIDADAADESFRTEANDDGRAAVVIPSSLTPPPSTQLAAARGSARAAFPSLSRHPALCSPPATTVSKAVPDREQGSGGAGGGDYRPPSPRQVLHASADELRPMLQICIAEQQKLKTETAHHRLQYNLLSLQADDDAKRSAVEHEMMRREVDALRAADHARQAKRELGIASDSTHAKYAQMSTWYEAAMEDNETLRRRLKLAKRVIQQKEEERLSLAEERDLLLTRIRENREHFHMLCSPGGIFHGAMTPSQPAVSTPQQARAPHRQTPRSSQKEDATRPEYGLSALLQAMSQSQDNNNNNSSAPCTPLTSHRAPQKHSARHSRNAQSMSSLPTTPLNRLRDSGGLLPSVDLVPRTEPRHRRAHQDAARPRTPDPKRGGRRRSRESTISADDNEELARQALQSVAGGPRSSRTLPESRTRTAPEQQGGSPGGDDDDDDDDDLLDSQASQAATELLRRHPGTSFEAGGLVDARQASPMAVEQSLALQSKMLRASRSAAADKRKLGSGNPAPEDGQRRQPSQPSPTKRIKVASLGGDQRVGLGIQYGR
ncbi:uncharacterized protein UV8b_08008 [Ustilaginoidea virens]|uniref:FAD-dependent oxidoreductase-like enzyme n=1 Tax=Ustilaginoidea virens TaxID=1159556 RepID=A0A8E5MLI4_USTVR|nr:uncharacterized protein UV8b_08008 [Ustilaginoidea virens]QUC23767.1 hypothetical protein UV8b_08008 [Ustilaginoidea virens]